MQVICMKLKQFQEFIIWFDHSGWVRCKSKCGSEYKLLSSFLSPVESISLKFADL